MSGQDSIQTTGCQSVSQARQALCEQMGEAGLGASTQAAYQRALEQFAIWLGGSNPSAVGVGRAHAYVAELKRIGAKQGVYANAQAALHFFYEKVLHRQWRPTTPLRERMREDMRLHRFSVKTQKSYERSVEKLALYHGRSPELLEPEDIRRYFVHLTCE